LAPSFKHGLLYHVAAFIIGAVTIWLTRADDIGSQIITLVFLIYLFSLNVRQRDCMPIFVIFALFKLVEFPFANMLFNKEHFYQYLFFIALYDAALAVCVATLYDNRLLRKLCNVNSSERKIKQVKAFVVVMIIAIVHIGLIAAEVANYQFNDGQLYLFYATYPEARASIKILEFFVLWSIFLDSQLQDNIRNAQLLSRTKKQSKNNLCQM
jgi:hypothetical protein